ncbi:nucleoporin Nup43 [Onthophagus taurus]|uniref:nucleoporin Nup43 n=1 Tax=Onthophagus taurus TaxID=166361 RepID=UPI000C2004FA|nr:nucleoporin Nup43 [Onthophagus taurus]
MSQNLHGTFVSEKINKIRWRPDPFDNAHSFITGSWDNETNHIKLWDFKESPEDADIYPYVVSEYNYDGDVTECRFLSPDLFVSSSTTGSVSLMRINVDEKAVTNISEEIEWKHIHQFKNGEKSSCISFAVYDNDFATVGEDGNIFLLTALRKEPARKIINADSCSIHCVTFLKHSEILTGNLRGHMKIWDLRSSSNTESSSFMMSGEQIAPTCLTFHPTQRHMVVAGDEEGSLTVWDLRHNTYPLNLLSAHSDSVTELQFHPDHPDQLFTSSSSGELWHWMVNKQNRLLINDDEPDSNVWLLGDSIKNKLEVYALMSKLHMPINTLDLNRNRILCGCDNEAIYLISNIKLY